jgi:hypothetical protein
MISKAIRGSGFSGAVSYICSKSDAIHMQNLVASDWRKAPAEMRAVANLNTTKKCVYHHILSFSPDERLSDSDMFKAAELMLKKLNLAEHQAVYAIHKDRQHWHVHTVVNLIDFSGKAEKLSHDFRSRPVYAREIESELNFKKYERKAPAKFSEYDIQNVFSSERISDIREILKSSQSHDEFHNSLSQIGIKIEEKSSRSNSLNYRFRDVNSGLYISGSKVDKALSDPTSLKRYFSRGDDNPNPKHIKPSQKDTDINLALKIRERLDKALSWHDAEIRLKEIGIRIDFIKSGERVRGIRFVNVEDNINIKASDISISYSHYQKLYETYSTNNLIEINENVKPDVKINHNKIISANPNRASRSVLDIRLPRGIKIDISSDIVKYVDSSRSDIVIAEDYKDHLRIMDQSNSSLLKSLQIAREKFPNGIAVSGNDDFKNRVIKVAAANNIRLDNLNELEKVLYAQNRPKPAPIQKPIQKAIKPDLVKAGIIKTMPHWQVMNHAKPIPAKPPTAQSRTGGGRER